MQKIKGMLDAYVADVGPILSEVIGTTPTMISRTTNVAGESAMGNLIAELNESTNRDRFCFYEFGRSTCGH